jgi:hypothetical protein
LSEIVAIVAEVSRAFATIIRRRKAIHRPGATWEREVSERVVFERAPSRLYCRREIMSEADTGGSACGATRYEEGNVIALGAADWLSLAAAPTFVIMALLTAVLAGGPSDILCSAEQDASSLSGMVPMYLLMSAFHLAPWLKLVSSRRSGVHGPDPAFTQDDRADRGEPACQERRFA